MPDSRPFFSVVMPVHNKAPYLDRSICSVIKQSFADFELLLINDASTDSSLIEMQRFSDPRVRILHRGTPGPGGYAARNLGIFVAKADWVAFLDADDEWYPEHLQGLYELARVPSAQVVATGWFDLFAGGGEATPNAYSAHHSGRNTVYLDFPQFLEEYYKGRKPVWTGVMAAQGALLQAIGGFPERCRRGGDSATWLRLVASSGGIHVATACTAIYHREASAVTKALPPEVRRNCIYEATQKLLTGIRSRRTRRQLMRVSNLHILPGLKSRALAGQLAFKDCGEYYFRVNWKTHVLFRLHSLLPGRLQPRVWRLYQRLKHQF